MGVSLQMSSSSTSSSGREGLSQGLRSSSNSSSSQHQALSSVPEASRRAASAPIRVDIKPQSDHVKSREPSTSPTTPRPELPKESSVQELLLSAKKSFGGGLSPGEGEVAIVHHPIRTRPSRMVVAQDWDAAGVEPPSPAVATPTSFSPEGKHTVGGWVDDTGGCMVRILLVLLVPRRNCSCARGLEIQQQHSSSMYDLYRTAVAAVCTLCYTYKGDLTSSIIVNNAMI